MKRNTPFLFLWPARLPQVSKSSKVMAVQRDIIAGTNSKNEAEGLSTQLAELALSCFLIGALDQRYRVGNPSILILFRSPRFTLKLVHEALDFPLHGAAEVMEAYTGEGSVDARFIAKVPYL
jgi:hypothetical protein